MANEKMEESTQTRIMSANPNPERFYCARCGEEIRTEWSITKSKEEGRNLCGLCRDDELNALEKTRANLNEAAEKRLEGWG